MKTAHDVYSETNPAFCTYALVSFVKTYTSVNAHGPEVPTVYLSLPVALSGELGSTFLSTNKNTGLLEWLGRNPQVQIGLAERVNACMEIVTESVRLGCFTGVLKIDEGARLLLGNRTLNQSAANALKDEPAQVLKRAERLGYWFAMSGSTRTVFDIMGLSV
jgi:Family of unknown function (DUF6521)